MASGNRISLDSGATIGRRRLLGAIGAAGLGFLGTFLPPITKAAKTEASTCYCPNCCCYNNIGCWNYCNCCTLYPDWNACFRVCEYWCPDPFYCQYSYFGLCWRLCRSCQYQCGQYYDCGELIEFGGNCSCSLVNCPCPHGN